MFDYCLIGLTSLSQYNAQAVLLQIERIANVVEQCGFMQYQNVPSISFRGHLKLTGEFAEIIRNGLQKEY